ncbi:LppP/LprE family lipoprotein [Streptomyces sp. NPDC051310]|uniref:LppP/LprE family lipoprotein n=1 Tax=Streptomyces sp. NPDC051310 TaxID=3365649 RepID=UPI0037A9FD85
MRQRLGTPAVAALLCLLAMTMTMTVTACGAAEDGVPPAARPSVSLWETADPSAKPSGDGTEPFDADRAVLRIKRLGFTADTDPATLKGLRGPLRAIHAHCTGSVDGHCVSVFFFHGNEYAGNDATGVRSSAITSQDGKTVTLSYPQFLRTDPQCCHSGGERAYRVRWKDGKVVFSPPLPEHPNDAGR